MTTNKRDNLQEAALAHLWMPTQDWSELAEDGVTVMAEADGVRIRDADGNWGYDGISGLMLVNVGHGRKEIVDAIAVEVPGTRDLPLREARQRRCATIRAPRATAIHRVVPPTPVGVT